MQSVPSQAIRPLSLNASLSSYRLPIFHKFRINPAIYRKSRKSPSFFTLRCCGSSGGPVIAKPSWELRRNRDAQEPDEKVVALRLLFSKPGIGIDAYIIPSKDAHQSEFIAECCMRRAYISGFTGSAGTAVVTKDKAALWTDGRYFLQAEKQLSSSWILMRAGSLGVPTTSEWLNDVLAPGGRVGIDPFLFSHDAAKELKEAISKKKLELVYLCVSKLSSLRVELAGTGASAIVISMLDEVAWLLNLRGSDVPHSPVMSFWSLYEVPNHLAKALKNPVELEGMQNCHLRDAAALAQFWCWLEEEIHKNVKLTEVDVADKLLEFRSKEDSFLDTSFDTISGSGANGAIIHYRPEPEICSVVDPNKLFLLDSGAQYVDGTTDITRTVHFGEPTAWEKECFTRVLKGHIALDQALFPENTPGFVLDAFARSALWKIGLDYRHGTRHGVGAALNVHEGPQSISYRYGNTTPLLKGMIVSNEPGYYEDHAFGIRIENLLCVQEINTPNRYGGIEYLGFEKLTFFPIQTKLVYLSLVSNDEIEWLNNYHSQVWEKVSPLLEGSARQWLWNNTRAIHKQ
ncbi:long chain acyl-CoA synthetase 7, peroxisomal-like isoform X1 [Hibiscus syriacus]|uniref:Long chain acyl-CoA synthetase 7, peroxisomal-like isoform X1 n=1 Tax=Hibiscus syriacus TaxID=106335 RepID=A0A6A2X2L3_HIBSY|nr:long chain acyl-CoA synthetase 7, peroxisomal-like isoform X1 [Hibiscus syriacus]